MDPVLGAVLIVAFIVGGVLAWQALQRPRMPEPPPMWTYESVRDEPDPSDSAGA